jgi:hypothetical protein
MQRITFVVFVVLSFTFGAHAQSAPTELCPKRMVGLKYPIMAQLSGAQGKIELEAIVLRDRTVKEANAISGPALLAHSMIEALIEWRFTGCSSTTVPCRYRVTFVFEMMTGSCELSQCPNEVEIDLPVITIRSQRARAIVN